MATILTQPTASGIPYYDETLSLDGTPYVFRFRFNYREFTWRLSLLTTTGEPLVEGIKLVPGVDLLAPFRADPRVPQGSLLVTTSGADDSPPGEDDFDTRTRLVYVTS